MWTLRNTDRFDWSILPLGLDKCDQTRVQLWTDQWIQLEQERTQPAKVCRTNPFTQKFIWSTSLNTFFIDFINPNYNIWNVDNLRKSKEVKLMHQRKKWVIENCILIIDLFVKLITSKSQNDFLIILVQLSSFQNWQYMYKSN